MSARVDNGYSPETWAEIMSRGSLNIPASRDVSIDVRRGAPSLTLNRYPGKWELRVVEYLREWGWLLPYRITVYVPPRVRRDASMQTIASYLQAAFLHAERAHRAEGR